MPCTGDLDDAIDCNDLDCCIRSIGGVHIMATAATDASTQYHNIIIISHDHVQWFLSSVALKASSDTNAILGIQLANISFKIIVGQPCSCQH